jgi:AcrR family transcriptional regulator
VETGERVRRRSDAVGNDARIIQAAREVFATQGYGARMSAVANRAGVAVGTLYGRYATKDELITQVNLAGMQEIVRAARAALEADTGAWAAFSGFLTECMELGAGGLLTLAGSVAPSAEQRRVSDQLGKAIEAVLDLVRRSGDLRDGVTAADLYLLFARLGPDPSASDPDRARQLQRRYLTVALDGLRASHTTPLPGPPATWAELKRRWRM